MYRKNTQMYTLYTVVYNKPQCVLYNMYSNVYLMYKRRGLRKVWVTQYYATYR